MILAAFYWKWAYIMIMKAAQQQKRKLLVETYKAL